MDEDPRRGPHASGQDLSRHLKWFTRLVLRILQPMGSIYQSGEFLNGWGGDERSRNLHRFDESHGRDRAIGIRRCPATPSLSSGGSIGQKHTFWHAVELELEGHFEMTNGENYPPYSGYGSVLVPVECLPYATIKGDVADGDSGAHNSTPPKIKEARLFLTTINGGKNQGVTRMGGCPFLETTVRFETDKAGPVSFDLHRFPGGTTRHTVNASFDASVGKYYARHQKREISRARPICNIWRSRRRRSAAIPDGRRSPSIAAAVSPNAGSSEPDDVLPPLQLKGDFSFPADQSTSCPREGKALIAFHTSVKNNVHYSLDCTNGHFSGVAQPVPKPGGGYVAPAVATFDITKTTQVTCALKSVSPGAPKVHVLKGHKYQCIGTTGASGSDDLAPDTRPDAQKPGKPGKFVADPPRKPEAPKADSGFSDAPKLVCAKRAAGEGRFLPLRPHRQEGQNRKERVPLRQERGGRSGETEGAATKTSGAKIKGDTKPEAKSDAKPPKLKGGGARASNTSSRLLSRALEKRPERARRRPWAERAAPPMVLVLAARAIECSGSPGVAARGGGKGPAPRGRDSRQILLAPPGFGTSRGLPGSPARTATRRRWHASRRNGPSGQAPARGPVRASKSQASLASSLRHS